MKNQGFDRVPRSTTIWLCNLVVVFLGVASLAQPVSGQMLPNAKPEEVGFSAERLQRLDAAMQQKVDEKQLAGIVTVLARHGKVVEFKTYGKKDLASAAPMERNTIFRIYSMTKPVTGAAMMMLYEEGRWQPDDPISKYIPEFAHLKVFKGVDNNGEPILEDPVHPPTMLQLMTHTAGFSYGFGTHLVDKMYSEKRVLQSSTLQEMIDKLAKLPLLYEPGTRWVYSLSVDIQGYLVEKLSGKSLPDFMRERIFEPLGMKDTGFYVPQEKMDRLATLYRVNEKNEWAPASGGDALGLDFSKQPTMPSGGGGLVSTAQDYLRFAQMLLNGGELDGVRILAPPTVRFMTSNHLPDKLLTGEFGVGLQHMRPGMGFGFDVAVFFDPAQAVDITGKGTFLWDGAAGTWFWIDPTDDVVFVGMIQRMGGGGVNMQTFSRAMVFQALVKP
ncbi:MAG TPA: serine hydrolase domain-containing protein [Terriglobia bacterium]|nr:serine hydrolase domain-containing protein [Terriglobia bacterium]